MLSDFRLDLRSASLTRLGRAASARAIQRSFRHRLRRTAGVPLAAGFRSLLGHRYGRGRDGALGRGREPGAGRPLGWLLDQLAALTAEKMASDHGDWADGWGGGGGWGVLE